MSSDVWTPIPTNNPWLCKKKLCALSKVAHVELFRGVARLVPQCAVTAAYGNRERRVQKIFSIFRTKRAKPKDNFMTTTVGESLFITQCQMRDLHTFKCKRPYNRTYNGRLQKLAEHNQVRTNKQLRFVASTETLLETRLKRDQPSLALDNGLLKKISSYRSLYLSYN